MKMFDKKGYCKQWRKDNPGYNKQYYQNNKEKILKQTKEYYIKNKEHCKEYDKKYYIKNREHDKEYCKKYYQKNKEHYKEYGRRYHQENREKILKRVKGYYQENKEDWRGYYQKNRIDILDKQRKYESSLEFKTYISLWAKKRRKTDLKYNISRRMSISIWNSIRENKTGRHWEDLINYKLTDLIKHLKSTMPKGYTWRDYLDGKLHIEHIIPIKVFNFTKPEHLDFKRCWALENLRLLPAKENLEKHAKLDRPFQPSLKIERRIS